MELLFAKIDPSKFESFIPGKKKGTYTLKLTEPVKVYTPAVAEGRAPKGGIYTFEQEIQIKIEPTGVIFKKGVSISSEIKNLGFKKIQLKTIKEKPHKKGKDLSVSFYSFPGSIPFFSSEMAKGFMSATSIFSESDDKTYLANQKEFDPANSDFNPETTTFDPETGKLQPPA